MEEFNDLIIKFLNKEITDKEQKQLAELVQKDSTNSAHFNEMVTSWQYAGTLTKSSSDTDTLAFQKLISRINKGKGKKRMVMRLDFIKVAASVLFAFILGGISIYVFFIGKQPLQVKPQNITVSTPFGTRSELNLADGTRVWLNAGSTITYNENFNLRSRIVNLIGEAYFKVAKDPSKPFVVNSGGMKVKALGTSFNIKAYPGDKTLIATLVEGKIVVEGKSTNQGRFSYTLEPNQIITLTRVATPETQAKPLPLQKNVSLERLDKREARPIENVSLQSNVNTALFTSWKDKRWIIERASFYTLAQMLERRYNVRIIYNQEEMSQISFTGTIENETLEQVIHILQLSAPLKYKLGKGEVTFSIDKSQQRRFDDLQKND
jgi:ferric-dicitrate binding protein FerR (iron transport regulator)